MDGEYSEFISILGSGDRSRSLEWAITRLRDGRMDVATLYTRILSPALKEGDCSGLGDDCIFNEHLRSSIVRTIVENAYPYVVEERRKRYGTRPGKSVLVTSPTDEYHDLAPRMAADLFTLAGFDVVFIGANAPSGVIASAVEHLRPDVLSISISNYFHIPTAAREVGELRARIGKMPLVVVGGAAFEHNKGAGGAIGADRVLATFEDIQSLAREG